MAHDFFPWNNPNGIEVVYEHRSYFGTEVEFLQDFHRLLNFVSVLIESRVRQSEKLIGLWLLVCRWIAGHRVKLWPLHVADNILRTACTWYKHRIGSSAVRSHIAFPSIE